MNVFLTENPQIPALLCEQYLLQNTRLTPEREARLIEVLHELDVLTQPHPLDNMALDEADVKQGVLPTKEMK
jgi:hypothetical protein